MMQDQLRRITRCAIVFGLIAILGGCQSSCSLFTTIDPDDAGHWSFVRQIVPKLLGRKVQGQTEAQLMVDVITAMPADQGRGELMNALMASPEFGAHWGDTLVDLLRVNREGIKGMSSCYASPMRATPDASLARLIAGQRADAPLSAASMPAPFNMADVVNASVLADNLFATYGAHVFAFEHKPVIGNETTEANRRDDLGNNFASIFLHRKLECMQCHHTSFSRSGPQTFWTRTFPVWGKFEASIFENEQGGDPARFNAMFRTGVSIPAPGQPGLQDDASSAAALAPWGNLQNCGGFRSRAALTDNLGVVPYLTSAQPAGASVWDVEGLLHQGRRTLATDGLVRNKPAVCSPCGTPACTVGTLPLPPEPTTTAIRTLFSDRQCFVCHAGASPAGTLNLEINTPAGQWANNLIEQEVAFAPGSGIKRVQRGSASGSYLITKLRNKATPATHPLHPLDVSSGGQGMPRAFAALSEMEIVQVESWIASLPTTGTPPLACAPCTATTCTAVGSEVDGPAALAYLVGMNVSDQVWQEMMGARLTISNYFPRSQDQMRVLWNLSEFTLIPNDWSLRELLKRIALSDYFNRRSPRTTAAATPYNEPLVRDPWVEADPRVPPVALSSTDPVGTVPPVPDPTYNRVANSDKHRNATSEGVHRHSVRSLTYSMHKALGWPAPRRFPGADYPSQELVKSIGQFSQDSEPGFRDADFQGLLKWEDTHKTCSKPAGIATDWIDRLLDGVRDHNLTTPATPLKKRQLALVMKDWFIGDPSLSTTVMSLDDGFSEKQVLDALFGGDVDTVNADASPAGRAALETQLREYCGVLVQTPQYWLAGLAPTGPGLALPLRVCNGTPCTYEEMCNQLGTQLMASGSRYRLVCGASSVSVFEPPSPMPFPGVDTALCRNGVCGFMPQPEELPLCLKGALKDPSRCLPERPPRCDLGCARIDCCGGPLPPLKANGLPRPSILLGWFEGSKIERADKLRVLPAAQRQGNGESTWRLAQPGQALAVGDLIEIAPGGSLEVTTSRGRFSTPRGGLPGRDDGQPWYLMVTGPSVARAEVHPVQAQKWTRPASEAQFIERYNEEQRTAPMRERQLNPKRHDPALRESMRSDAAAKGQRAQPAGSAPAK